MTENSAQEKPVPSKEETDTTPQYQAEKELFSWNAPARSFQKHSHEYWIKFMTIASIFAVILYIIEGLMPVLLIIALIFLYYVLSTVEPEPIRYSITNAGLKIGNSTTEWPYITQFWFSKRANDELIIFQTTYLPGRLELVSPADKEKLKKILLRYIPEEEKPPNRFDRAADWLSNKLTEQTK